MSQFSYAIAQIAKRVACYSIITLIDNCAFALHILLVATIRIRRVSCSPRLYPPTMPWCGWGVTLLLMALMSRRTESRKQMQARMQRRVEKGAKTLLKPRSVDGVELSFECAPFMSL